MIGHISSGFKKPYVYYCAVCTVHGTQYYTHMLLGALGLGGKLTLASTCCKCNVVVDAGKKAVSGSGSQRKHYKTELEDKYFENFVNIQ